MIIVDTGFWLALIDKKDTYHESAKQALKKYNERLITTWCVVTETCYLLLIRKGIDAEINFINSLQQELFTIFNLEPHPCLRLPSPY
ncbi:type II toxin-antitoxin system VapC family toxin [Nostoc sp.]|uniref:type II toxin-antitoxin system VapC family toxin n=1 Tax=Nostoc sp. TaxID=1180 RepID=UPI002FF58DDC